MSAIKELLHRVREGVADPKAALYEIAEALGGDVEGPTKIVAPSPGCGANDRSMVIFFSTPWHPDKFYIYTCEGSLREAKALVREKLALVAPGEEPDATERSIAALKIWGETEPARGTYVETYLRSRGITLPIPDRIRFHGRLKHTPTGSYWAAMVALVTDVTDMPIAIHRVYLGDHGRDKAPVEPDKMSLGPLRGNAVRLSKRTDDLMVGEGIETCLSAMMVERPAWAAVSAMGLSKLKLPDTIRSVTILVDGDNAGERAANAAADRWISRGLRVLLVRAPWGKDFNDVLMEDD